MKMKYKTGDKIYEIKDRAIKEHTITEWKYVTWIQAINIDGKWRDSRDFYSSIEDAEHELQRKPKP
jgi:hypothetical protein